MDRNMKIGVAIVMIALIAFGGNYLLRENKIKKANISGYVFLEKISKCDITYNINIMTGSFVAEFEEECFEDAAKNLRDISFEPGETGDKFILESEEYLGCAEINKLKGAEFYRNCIKKILPIIEEKYPEVVVD